VVSRRQVLGRLAVSAAVPAGLAGCSAAPTNFSQYPGFTAFYAAHPRRNAPADAADQALLSRFRPRFYLPPGHTGAIDFYADYIAHGRLVDGAGTLVSQRVTAQILNAHKDDPRAVFTHVPEAPGTLLPSVFGRVDHDTLHLNGQRHDFSFLTYHAVFRHSGLAAGLAGWRAALLGLVGDLGDWHQLDHYTAASVVLDAAQRPVALMLQQHNYHHSLAFGAAQRWPADERIGVDVAERSNELYPHAGERRRHRAVRFNSPDEMRYLMGIGNKPLVAEDDITEGRVELAYGLAFLAPSDAFYTFQGYLGARRLLPGRDGPPGADFNTLPDVKPLLSQLLMGFWREGNRDDLARLNAGYGRSGRQSDFVAAQAPPFLAAIGVPP
jgi:hypothetical protein